MVSAQVSRFAPTRHPEIIQGGMGVAVSGWRLANSVSREGQLGVVSGTALDTILTRRLQMGDLDGEVRRAIAEFPIPRIAEAVLERYFVPGGKPEGRSFKSKPVLTLPLSQAAEELLILANFVEVFLAKSGHEGAVGINYLEKIQLPTLPSLLGAMLAGVDYVLMGAGIPRAIPGILDRLSQAEPVEQLLEVRGAEVGEQYRQRFDPRPYAIDRELKRPFFVAIVSSSTLAATLARKATPPVDGFVVEAPSAGGHNAPPRGRTALNERGEPIYGERDSVDLRQIDDLGLPFWLAGGRGAPGELAKAKDVGAVGIQVGTAFAYCVESGLSPAIKAQVLARSARGSVEVFTDPNASPTGYPFKVVALPGTLSDDEVYRRRKRMCDLGYLRELYVTPEGKIGYRCAGEPEEDYLRKGGTIEDTRGRKCICNGLVSAVDMPQVRRQIGAEPAIVTSGNEVARVSDFLPPGADSYSARDVIERLLS